MPRLFRSTHPTCCNNPNGNLWLDDYSAITPSTNPDGSSQNSRPTLKRSVCPTVTGSSPYFDGRNSRAFG